MGTNFPILTADCLVELLSRCDTRDALALEQASLRTRALGKDNHLVWQRRLWADYGINAAFDAASRDVKGNPLRSFLKRVHEESPDQKLRFQGVLCNGGVDENNFSYWIDNIFAENSSPWCSDCSENADCLALLLDGSVAREEEYNDVRKYMRERCAYAGALLEQLHNPEAADPRVPEEAMRIVSAWKDPQLESFFLAMVTRLHRNQPMGRLLLAGINSDMQTSEANKIAETARFLRRRSEVFLEELMHHPSDPKTMFDSSVVHKTADPLFRRLQYIGLIRGLEISRAGSLTCPVSSGVVLAGIVNYKLLEGAGKDDAFHMLYEASRHEACMVFNSLDSEDAVKESARRAIIPSIASENRSRNGVVLEFDSSWNDDPCLGGVVSRDCFIVWRPVVWFRFHTRHEASTFRGASSTEAHSTENHVEDEAESTGNAQQPQYDRNNANMQDSSARENGQEMRATIEGASVMAITERDYHGSQGSESGSISDDEDLSSEDAIEVDGSDEDVPFSSDEEGDMVWEMTFPELLTANCNVLKISLKRYIPATALMIKMINQENFMEQFQDNHSWPNIDMTSCKSFGKKVEIPAGVVVTSSPFLSKKMQS